MKTDLSEITDPIATAQNWLAAAEKSEPSDANAMSLATVDSDGLPNVRMVLLKDISERGFVFYTNFHRQKGVELLTTKKAALCLHWKSVGRQIRARGDIEVVTEAEADAYFNSRHPVSRLGANASRQSEPLKDRKTLEDAVQAAEQRYGHENIPRPSHWSGFRILPVEIEIWENGDYRIHNRIRFTRANHDLPWAGARLYP
jgi:pyridoxamine 5'-phosphate oxidase